MTFNDLNLHSLLVQAIELANYTTPTAIQAQAIPVILQGKDLMGCAQTGTGKTASFVLPILHQLLESDTSTQEVSCLILAPTRELVQQICANIQQYAALTPIKHVAIYGGKNPAGQLKQLRSKPQIIVATPGRLLEFVDSKHIDLRQVKHFVLDEADQMLDMGFVKPIQRIIQHLPSQKQTLLFSATMPREIYDLAKKIQRNPQEVIIQKISSTVTTVAQSIVYVNQQDKTLTLERLIKGENHPKCIVFVRTKHGADALVKKLYRSGIHSTAIHGNKSQNFRDRALADFKDNKSSILIATDVAARGIDIEQLPLVVNFDLPNVPETYVHRIGRTGRAGNSGKAVSFCSPQEDKELKSIQKLIGTKIQTEILCPQ